MSIYKSFYDNILPGNYFLTKSMELGRVNTSGTLWYTKKFLVYYYYIFLKDDIETKQYVSEIISIFDAYISTLPIEVQATANKFFYSENEFACLKSEKFKYFNDFIGNITFADPQEKRKYYDMAKKYYFAFLMEIGGQSKVKAKIRESMYTESFVFSDVDKIIIDYFRGSSVEYNLIQIKNDYMAALRNERQVLYYYGYFHSKSTGANDMEFSSLTPIGEIALYANYREFLALWEHQKYKMISQPVTVTISNLPGDVNQSLALNYNPYLDILKYLSRNERITKEEYMYILSRKNSKFTDEEWETSEKEIIDNIEDIKNKIISFERTRDVDAEDFSKELKKYMLGILSNLENDNKTNFMGLCEWNSSTWIKLDNQEKLNKILRIYESINIYRLNKYTSLFEQCESELNRQYLKQINKEDYSIDAKLKIDWDLYNIYPDNVMMLGIICTQVLVENNLDIDTVSESKLIDEIENNYKSLAVRLGYTSKGKLKKEIAKLKSCIMKNNYDEYLLMQEEERTIIKAAYLKVSTNDLYQKIQDTSEVNIGKSYTADRRRDTALISMLKSYMIINNVTEKAKCECCNDELFVTQSDEPYMEFHHLIPFGGANQGPDHYLNLYALCPMCHRKIHFINLKEKAMYYQKLSQNNFLKINFIDRLKELKKKSVLKSYQLEYLLADKAIDEDGYNKIVA